jgi:flagellar motor component MotA
MENWNDLDLTDEQLIESLKKIDYKDEEQLIKILSTFSDQARKNGLLHLESFARAIKNSDLQLLIQLCVDGVETELIKKIAENRKQNAVRQMEKFYDIMTDGVLGMVSGINPRVLSVLMNSHTGTNFQD